MSIPTMYAGIMFRSRLEAKWAAFFDLAGWRWQYEPLDLAGYIPDFILLMPNGPIAVEVKPLLWSAHDVGAIYVACKKMGAWPVSSGEALLVGACLPVVPDMSCFESIGMIREPYTKEGGAVGCGSVWSYSFVFRCRKCSMVSVASSAGHWMCRVNGCYDGDHYLDYVNGEAEGTPVEDMFRKASNMTQWRGR